MRIRPVHRPNRSPLVLLHGIGARIWLPLKILPLAFTQVSRGLPRSIHASSLDCRQGLALTTESAGLDSKQLIDRLGDDDEYSSA